MKEIESRIEAVLDLQGELDCSASSIELRAISLRERLRWVDPAEAARNVAEFRDEFVKTRDEIGRIVSDLTAEIGAMVSDAAEAKKLAPA